MARYGWSKFKLGHYQAIASLDKGAKVSGHVDIDGMYADGYVKLANYKDHRRDRRLLKNYSDKRQVVIAARERNGKMITFVSKTEAASVPMLHKTKRINHSLTYSDGEGCTNQVESFFSRLRSAEIGTRHHIAAPYFAAYAAEMDWREDNRRRDNGDEYATILSATAHHPQSKPWKGYWQWCRADRH